MRYSFLMLVLFQLFCSTTEPAKKEIQTGVEIKKNLLGFWELKAIGKATQMSIDQEQQLQKESSSCQAARDLTSYELKQLDPTEKNHRRYLEIHKSYYLESGQFCVIESIYEKPNLEPPQKNSENP